MRGFTLLYPVLPLFRHRSWLTRNLKYTASQTALLRRIIDRIRNSLELKVVLQTAVDEVTGVLRTDRCAFLWYFQESQRVQVVCEQISGEHINGDRLPWVGHFPLAQLGSLAPLIRQGQLVVTAKQAATRKGIRGLLDRLIDRLSHRLFLATSPDDASISDPGFSQLFSQQAMLLVPVSGREGSIGFIVCLSEQRQVWSAEEVDLMQAIAQQLEIAVRQAQLYERTQKQAQRERVVNQITAQTRQSLDLKTILQQAIAQLLDALDVDRCLVHLVENLDQLDEITEPNHPLEHGRTVFRRKHLFEVCRPPFPASINDFDPDGPMTRWVIQHRQQAVIDNVSQDLRIGPHNAEYQTAQIKSSLVVPVQASGSLQAILYLNQCAHVRNWTRDDQKLAQAVADQLAISIQQGHLYAQSRQQAQESAAQAKQLAETLQALQQTQAQLIQSEKMSSLGQMVAGIAHEINNPISFIYGNIPYVERYLQDTLRLITAYQTHYPQATDSLQSLIEEVEPDFIVQDLPRILSSMRSGAGRIREIVSSLRTFSRLDEAYCKVVDLHDGLESTLSILKTQIPADVHLRRQYGELPPVECFPSLLNQVFLHLLQNALEALDHRPLGRHQAEAKEITITTEASMGDRPADAWVTITISDNGCGIYDLIQPKIFDPFFTTKEIGQGCGLGLAISYQTVVHQHRGHLSCSSTVGQGSTFVVKIPIEQPTVGDGDRAPQVLPASVYPLS